MKKAIISLCLPFLLFGYTDLGKAGHTYPIIENNFFDDIKKGISELDVEELREQTKKEVYKQAMGENNLGYCKDYKEVTEEDYVLLQDNIYSPSGRLFQEKGTKMYASIDKPLDLCFIDGTYDVLLENQVDYFDRITNKKCIYLVSNRSIMEVYKKYPTRSRDFYPARKVLETRFNVECKPTHIHLIKNDRIKKEHGIDKFKQRVEQ